MNSVGDEGGRTGQFYDPHGIALSKDGKVFSQNGKYPKFCCTIFTRGVHEDHDLAYVTGWRITM